MRTANPQKYELSPKQHQALAWDRVKREAEFIHRAARTIELNATKYNRPPTQTELDVLRYARRRLRDFLREWQRLSCPKDTDHSSLEDSEVEVVRYSGGWICPACGKEARDHPDDPACPWPTFVLLCDGTHAKL